MTELSGSIADIFLLTHSLSSSLPSVLWHCWLGGRKGIRPVKMGEWWLLRHSIRTDQCI